ncbi:MAG TPA: DoxX family protein [Catalimonadaceae bacterium]|nr:DoxX family protein [Catalimonadaceae bacterium]
MKILLQFFRIFTGALFIFSGSVKLIDPVGTQIKMEEYFEVFAQAFHPFFEHFVAFALPIAVIMCVAEVVMGFALLLFYKMRINMWLFLLLMIFFTFLTGYTAMALYAKEHQETGFAGWFASFAGVASPAEINAVSDCGCFGDFIKLRPWESFLKDLILMVPTLFLFWNRKKLESEFKESVNVTGMVLSLGLSCFVAWHAIEHLPMFDFRPYKVGANIKKNMEPSEPLRYVYFMERNGETKEFTEYPTDTTWKFKTMEVANPDAKPKITDYSLWNDEGDFTQQSFEGNKLFLIIRKADKVDPKDLKKVASLFNNMAKLGSMKIECSVITGSDAKSMELLRHEAQLAVPYYYGDGTVLKTIMRSNAGLWMLKYGEVKGKWHLNDCPDIHEVIESLK